VDVTAGVKALFRDAKPQKLFITLEPEDGEGAPAAKGFTVADVRLRVR
jgi:hypothetical protein